MTWWKSIISSRPHPDRRLLWLLRASAVVSATVVVLILALLLIESWTALRDIGATRFLTDRSWHPTEDDYGLAPMLAGTVLCSLGALLLAVPSGIAAALFANEYAPAPLAAAFRRLIELLAGLPSVVYGLWGLTTLVPIINHIHPPGTSLLAGMLVLALMILPTIALTADAALSALPPAYHAGAAALGLARWSRIRGVLLPAARAGITTGILLAAARAVGETMAVLMVCGNVVQLPGSLFDPVRTLTANIALEMAYAMGIHRAALFVSALLLMLLTLAMVAGARRVASDHSHA